jgi:HAD superfamily hydrolase (TIGR01490 family)
MVRLGAGRERLNRVYYRAFRGVDRAELLGLVSEWYEEINRSGGLYISRTIQILREHRREGVKVVVVSGSFHELLHPILENIGVDYCLATNLETKDGEFTGEIIPPQMIGEGKAQAVKDFIGTRNIDPALCYAYGDDSSDIPMLAIVGSPALVTSDPDLIDLAGRRAWRVIPQG